MDILEFRIGLLKDAQAVAGRVALALADEPDSLHRRYQFASAADHVANQKYMVAWATLNMLLMKPGSSEVELVAARATLKHTEAVALQAEEAMQEALSLL